MHINLTGKTALVTGSTSGIGLAIATELAKSGAQLIVVGREQEKLNHAMTEVNQASGRDDTQGIVADAASAEGLQDHHRPVPSGGYPDQQPGYLRPV